MAKDALSAMEKLAQTNGEMELWWDSSPLIFSHWVKTMLADAEVREKVSEDQLRRLYNEEEPEKSLFRGVTTNPPLTKRVIDTFPEEWDTFIDNLLKATPELGVTRVMWETYREVCRQGAKNYLPIFDASRYRYGYVSAQVDPRVLGDARVMMEQALGLASLAPNIMVKIPGTQAGLLVISLLTSLGIPTNATLVFTLPQIMSVAEAVRRGRELGEAYGTDFARWRSVITIMIGRFEDNPVFDREAEEAGVELTEEKRRWAGLAIAKKAYRLLQERGYASKLLVASSRVSPKVGGEQRIWHIEKLAGGAIVYTMNPELIRDFMVLYADRELAAGIDEPVPHEVLEELLRIPYFARAYVEDGISPEEFIDHPATQATKKQFSGAVEALETYIEDRRREKK